MMTRDDINKNVMIVTKIDDSGLATYTLKFNKYMSKRKQEWIEIFKTCDEVDMIRVVEGLTISLIQLNRSFICDYGYDRGWDATFVALRRAGCLEMEEEHDEI